MRREEGLTLVELIVVMAIASIFGMALMSFFVTMTRSAADQNAVVDMQSAGRIALGKMVRVLRDTGLDPLGIADAGIEEARGDFIQVSRDLNANGEIGEGERITFEEREGELRRVEGGRVSVLARGVTGLTFSYFDERGFELPEPGTDRPTIDRIARIDIRFEMQARQSGGGTLMRSFGSTVTIRN